MTKEAIMRIPAFVLLTAFASAVASTLVLAQVASDPLERPAGNAAFKGMDKNGDGFVSRAEAAADEELAKNFATADTNRDGRLTEAEFVKYYGDRDKQYVDDATITAKVKALLLREKGIPSTDIAVETSKGRVQLSGFVPTRDVITRAGRIAAGVEGVREVRNNLNVR
jgi:hyperosmotically inducible protein